MGPLTSSAIIQARRQRSRHLRAPRGWCGTAPALPNRVRPRIRLNAARQPSPGLGAAARDQPGTSRAAHELRGTGHPPAPTQTRQGETDGKGRPRGHHPRPAGRTPFQANRHGGRTGTRTAADARGRADRERDRPGRDRVPRRLHRRGVPRALPRPRAGPQARRRGHRVAAPGRAGPLGQPARPGGGAGRLRPGADQVGGRRQSVDLQLQKCRHPQHPRLREGLSRRRGDQARAELPLDRDDSRRGERRHRAQPRAEAEEPVDRGGQGGPDHDRRARRRARRGSVRRRRGRAPVHGGGDGSRRDLRLLPRERAEPGAGGHARAVRAALPGDRRHEVLRPRRDQGRRRLPPVPREPGRRGLLPARRQLTTTRHRRPDAGAAALARQYDRAPTSGT